MADAITDVVAELRELLTPRLVAYVAGEPATRVTREWAEGRRGVPAAVEPRLRAAHRAARVVADAYDAPTAQAWMQGTDPALEDRSPATALRDGEAIAAVLAAARSFAVT